MTNARVTVHEHPEPIQLLGSDSPEGVDITFAYNVTIDQIDILVSVSLVCQQYLSWQCLSAPITDALDSKTPAIYWGNKDDDPRFYWGGVKDLSQRICACGESKSCARPELSCNCDANDDVRREDAGYITSRADVPVVSFHMKKTGELSISWQHVYE